MKTEPQNAMPANSETEGSHVDAETRENPRQHQELPTRKRSARDGWRAYFPAAVRKTLKRREDESRANDTFEDLQVRFAKTLV